VHLLLITESIGVYVYRYGGQGGRRGRRGAIISHAVTNKQVWRVSIRCICAPSSAASAAQKSIRFRRQCICERGPSSKSRPAG
jgi:hypothetical protein